MLNIYIIVLNLILIIGSAEPEGIMLNFEKTA